MRNIIGVSLLSWLVSSALWAEPGLELRRQRISMPVAIELCEHVSDAILYEKDAPLSVLPFETVFELSHYATVNVTLPEQLRLEVSGRYVDDGAPFVRGVTLHFDNLHIASPRSNVELKSRKLVLSCERHCARRVHTAPVPTEP